MRLPIVSDGAEDDPEETEWLSWALCGVLPELPDGADVFSKPGSLWSCFLGTVSSQQNNASQAANNV